MRGPRPARAKGEGGGRATRARARAGNDVLVTNWSPTLNVRYIFTTLHELLKHPNTETPLEPEIAQLMMEKKAEYLKKAAEYTKKHAS